MNTSQQSNKAFVIDDRPIEMLSHEERKARFDRQIGPEIPFLSAEDIKEMKEFYMLDE